LTADTNGTITKITTAFKTTVGDKINDFSKKFLNNNLSVTIFANDVFDTNQQGFNALGTNLIYESKNDSRRYGISLNYKIYLDLYHLFLIILV
jgi:hypothetical protein